MNIRTMRTKAPLELSPAIRTIFQITLQLDLVHLFKVPFDWQS